MGNGVCAVYKPLALNMAGIAVCGRLFRLEKSATTDPAAVTCKLCKKLLAKPPTLRKRYEPKPTTKLDQYIGEQIRHFRSEAGISQYALGKLLGMSQAWVSKLELGGASINLEMLITYADALGKKVDDFLPPRKKGKMVFT